MVFGKNMNNKRLRCSKSTETAVTRFEQAPLYIEQSLNDEMMRNHRKIQQYVAEFPAYQNRQISIPEYAPTHTTAHYLAPLILSKERS